MQSKYDIRIRPPSRQLGLLKPQRHYSQRVAYKAKDTTRYTWCTGEGVLMGGVNWAYIMNTLRPKTTIGKCIAPGTVKSSRGHIDMIFCSQPMASLS